MPIFTDDYETKVTLEAGGAPLPDEMPFRLLLLGNWSGRGEHPALYESKFGERRPVFIDRDNFEDVIRKLSVELALDLSGDGRDILRLRFSELDDFHPDHIFHQVPLFSDLRETRRRLANPQTFNSAALEVRKWLSGSSSSEESVSKEESSLDRIVESQPAAKSDNFLDQILSQAGEAPENRSQAPATASKELNALLGNLVRPYLVQTDEAEQSKLLAAVDEASGELMRKILHHPQFQELEAAWRGAYLLISRVETDTDLKLYLLDATKDELKTDLKSVTNLNDSAFYKLLSEKTVGSYTEEAWAAVFGNYVFSADVDDTATLMRIAQISAETETPFIAQASPRILGTKSFDETPDSNDWRLSEDSSEAKLWAMLRGLPEAPYLGLTIPRMMVRMPYGAKSEPTENFDFEELDASAPEHNNYLWANSIFACAILLAQSFRAMGWEMSPSAAQEIEDLPMHMYREAGETKIKPCAEIVMTLKAAEKILEQGLMPLLSFKDSDRVRLARFQSIASPSTTLRGKWAA